MAETPEAAADLAAGVREVLTSHLEDDPGELRVSPVPGGASRETWLVTREASGRDGEVALCVLRRDPEGSISLVPMRDEFALLECARRADVPVPQPIACEDGGGAFGSAGLLMEFVEGTSVAQRVLRKPEYEGAREVLTGQLARALARIHALGPEDVKGVLPQAPASPVAAQLDDWEGQLDRLGEPLPAVELGLRWLRLNSPDPVEPVLVHGDYRLGNFIVDEDGLAAVIDWELSHLGDPAEDLGWLCIRSWRFGNDGLPVAGLGTLEEFLSAYEAAGGEAIDARRVGYWEVFGNVKWALICASQAQDHLTGVRRSHELASLGRRICEPEWDMLVLIGADEGRNESPRAAEA
jgi:aminoglycoside phosphotransferase (APT) family kinase protein